MTTSSKKERLEGYLDVGDIELTHDDVKALDKAGEKGQQQQERKAGAIKAARVIAAATLFGFAASRLVTHFL